MIRLSLIIATHNRAAQLLETLESVVRQDLPAAEWECIVVDNNCTDDTAVRFAAFAAAHPACNLRLVDEPRPGVSPARNRGVAKAAAPVVAIIDDDERLRGVFPLKRMITSPSVSKVKHVMKKDPISVKVDTPIDEVAQLIEKYDLVAIPVVDSIGRLVGRITVDDVMDEVREQAEREYQLASGLSTDTDTDDNVIDQTKARLPWLMIGMIGGICNSLILGNFDSTFQRYPEMALYIPLIGGTGGNVGTQSSAIIVQGLAKNSLSTNKILKQVLKESLVAIVNATIISMLVYVYNFIRFGSQATVTYSVSISLFAVVMFASIFGTLVPLTFEKMKIDPAMATGPFIAIINDITGMLLYMGITVLLS